MPIRHTLDSTPIEESTPTGPASRHPTSTGSQLELYWIPVGAGARVVRTSGRIYERCIAMAQRRPAQPLLHSALVADTDQGRYYAEMTPVPRNGTSELRGVVGGGAVGSRTLGRLRVFRYEIRCWLDGVIPDLNWAVDSPVVISTDADEVRRVLALLPLVPGVVWGRDELRTGEMWNSNSVISWALERAGISNRAGPPPRNGRAPGWDAGIAVARREPRTGPSAQGAGTNLSTNAKSSA